MKKVLITLSVLFLSLTMVAMEVVVQKSQRDLNEELFELVQKVDATAEQVIKLIDQGASVHARNKQDLTALALASSICNEKVCEALIIKGASVKAKNAKSGSDSVCYEPLYHAVVANNFDACKALLRQGADVFFINDGEPSLCIALKGIIASDSNDFSRNYRSLFNMLLKYSWAMPNLKDSTHSSETIKLLLFIFKKNRIPRDVRFHILHYLPDHLCNFFLSRSSVKATIPRPFHEPLAQSILRSTIDQSDITNYPVTPDWRIFADENYEEDLYKNIRARIENPPTIHPDQRSPYYHLSKIVARNFPQFHESYTGNVVAAIFWTCLAIGLIQAFDLVPYS